MTTAHRLTPSYHAAERREKEQQHETGRTHPDSRRRPRRLRLDGRHDDLRHRGVYRHVDEPGVTYRDPDGDAHRRPDGDENGAPDGRPDNRPENRPDNANAVGHGTPDGRV